MSVSPEQVLAARRSLNWSQELLANRSEVSKATVSLFERGVRRPSAANVSAIRRALENAGIKFLNGHSVALHAPSEGLSSSRSAEGMKPRP